MWEEATKFWPSFSPFTCPSTPTVDNITLHIGMLRVVLHEIIESPIEFLLCAGVHEIWERTIYMIAHVDRDLHHMRKMHISKQGSGQRHGGLTERHLTWGSKFSTHAFLTWNQHKSTWHAICWRLPSSPSAQQCTSSSMTLSMEWSSRGFLSITMAAGRTPCILEKTFLNVKSNAMLSWLVPMSLVHIMSHTGIPTPNWFGTIAAYSGSPNTFVLNVLSTAHALWYENRIALCNIHWSWMMSTKGLFSSSSASGL